MEKKVYITTAIDYANAIIHIGHAYEKILADCVARYYRLKIGKENVGFTTGTDEHGTTNEKAAKLRNIDPIKHVTEISESDKKEIDSLNISYDRFIRTTDKDHKDTAYKFTERVFANGDIYKDTYEGLYCEGCEAYKTLNELNEEEQCPLHITREIQKYEEENYFFAWSKYADFLKELVSSNDFVAPEGKKKAMLAFIENGIEDIPISRPKYKLNWGINFPGDEEQVIYVWFDALINYFTYGSQNNLWDEDTKIIHFVGKDIARWHVLLWPAMLKSAGYKLPNKVYIHGFINLNGEKISKYKGNVIKPSELTEKYGTDAVRYYFLKNGPIVEDVDISIRHFEEVYNGELANGLGNTIARVGKLAERSGFKFELDEQDLDLTIIETIESNFRVDLALQNIWKKLANIDKHINENEPWKITDKEKLKDVLEFEVTEIRKIAKLLLPFIPTTATKIIEQFSNQNIKATKGLFPRID